jgi:hypothetical protein
LISTPGDSRIARPTEPMSLRSLSVFLVPPLLQFVTVAPTKSVATAKSIALAAAVRIIVRFSLSV